MCIYFNAYIQSIINCGKLIYYFLMIMNTELEGTYSSSVGDHYIVCLSHSDLLEMHIPASIRFTDEIISFLRFLGFLWN